VFLAEGRTERRLTAILAADIAGYSQLMGTDEARTVRDLKAHQAVLLPMVADFGGRIIDTAGDGILAEFASVVRAVECAVAIQKTMAERNAVVDQARRMQFRIGVNIGDVIYDDARIYGDGINVAARLEGIAEPGGVCVSEDAYRQTRGKVSAEFTDIGEQSLKNIARPVRAYKVGSSAIAAPELPQRLSSVDKPSIAVLPFLNLSSDPEQEYLADGMTEEITTALSRVRGFFVISRTSSFTYKGKVVELKQVGRELGVRYVLEGSLRKAGTYVRITTQLVDAETGYHIWADRYDRELVNIFAAQDEITERVVTAIEPQLYVTEGHRAKRKPPESLDAWECVIRALSLMNTRVKTDIAIASELLNKAIDLDQNYAQAHSLLSYIMTLGVHLGRDAPEPTLRTATDTARKAALLDDDEPWAHVALGYALVWSKQPGAAVAELQKALALNPNFAIAHYVLALALGYLGRGEEALAHGNEAALLSPRDLLTRGNAGVTNNVRCFACFVAGRYLEGIEFGRQAVSDSPNSPAGVRPLLANYALAGKIEDAKETLQTLKRVQPDISIQWINETLPFASPETLQRYIEAFKLAGLE
jgi:TolB-like protein/tetratricopeptide (TPR) repeat protein